VQARTVLMRAGLVRSDAVSATTAALVEDRLSALAETLEGSRASNETQRAHDRFLAELIAEPERMDQLLDDNRIETPTPPGSPIGAEACWHCEPSTGVDGT
jgi:hypothetical protein